MHDLVDWLNDQLDAAEASTRRLLGGVQQTILELKDVKLLGKHIPGWGHWPEVRQMCQQRLDEIEADRHVLAEYKRLLLRDPLRVGPYWDGQRDAWEMAVRMRAEAYDDQPGYQERWRRP